MNEAEQKAIDIASHYTEKYLMGVYSREKQSLNSSANWPRTITNLKNKSVLS